MRVTMASVMSADARITQGEKVKTTFWRSAEDGMVLQELIKAFQVLIMGRHTYAIVKPKPSKRHLQIVLTSTPKDYADQVVPGQLEFVTAKPSSLIQVLESRGYTSVLLLGGSSNVPFLTAGLVDDMYLTVEPALFGEGLPLTGNLQAALSLKLLDIKQLNRQGTILLHYQVIKPGLLT